MTVPAPLPEAASPTQPLPTQVPISSRDVKARDAAEHFESMFLSTLLSSMFTNVDAGIFGGGPGEKVFRSMYVEEVAKSVAQRGGIGIADHVYAEIMKTQEVAP